MMAPSPGSGLAGCAELKAHGVRLLTGSGLVLAALAAVVVGLSEG